MQFDMRTLPATSCYKLMASSITPRPIAWVTSLSATGILNAAPYSFFNMMGDDPPTLVIGLMRRSDGSYKDTARNILDTGEFVVNLVAESDAAAMNVTCMDAPPEVDEASCAGLDLLPSSSVAPPRIASAPVSFECKLIEAVQPGGRLTIAIAEVLITEIADRFILDPERLHIDTLAMRLIGRMHGSGWYTRSSDLFQLDRPSYADWLASQPR